MSPTLTAAAPPQSPFRKKLRHAIVQELEPEIILAERVAVMTAAGFRKSEISIALGATGTQLKNAFERAKGAAERLDPGDPAWA